MASIIEPQGSGALTRSGTGSRSKEVGSFIRRAIGFLSIALLLYGAACAASEHLVYKYARRNRFFMVHTAPRPQYDVVILGASHATVFDYENLNARLERMTDSTILNLSVVGGGVAVNRLLLEYFLSRHRAAVAVYFVDSFAFYSRAWNEERLQDTRLFARAPLDADLAHLLLSVPGNVSTAFDYLSGFSKINNADRFSSDVSDEEARRFARTYRPVPQLDRQRIEYLYGGDAPQRAASLEHYMAEFEDLIRYAGARGLRFVAIKPPVPDRIYALLPGESQFDEALREVLARHGVVLHDFSRSGNAEHLFYDTDHLNRQGVEQFFDSSLKDVLVRSLAGE